MRQAPGALWLVAALAASTAAAGETALIDLETGLCDQSLDIESSELAIETGGVTLAATVLWTPGCIRGGAVLIQGSGTSDRSNRWAGSVARLLAGSGLATVFPDKRGSGASEGDWLDGGYELLAEDALATVAHLRRDVFVGADPAVGLVGLSEGGRVAPIAAASSDGGRVDFVVAISSGVVPFLDTLDHEIRNTYRQWGLTAEETARFLAVDAAVVRFAESGGAGEWADYQTKLEALLAGPQAERARRLYPAAPDDKRWRWFREVMHNDPLTHWEAVQAPAFFAFGEEDEAENVPVRRSVERLELARSPSQDWEMNTYPGSGHGLWEPGERGRTLNLSFQRDLRRFLDRVLDPGGSQD